jgi:hypothetical protein
MGRVNRHATCLSPAAILEISAGDKTTQNNPTFGWKSQCKRCGRYEEGRLSLIPVARHVPIFMHV